MFEVFVSGCTSNRSVDIKTASLLPVSQVSVTVLLAVTMVVVRLIMIGPTTPFKNCHVLNSQKLVQLEGLQVYKVLYIGGTRN